MHTVTGNKFNKEIYVCVVVARRFAIVPRSEYIIAWFRGTRCNEVATSARVVVPGSVRARVGLCQLINRRFAVHAASDVPNRKFSKNQ